MAIVDTTKLPRSFKIHLLREMQAGRMTQADAVYAAKVKIHSIEHGIEFGTPRKDRLTLGRLHK